MQNNGYFLVFTAQAKKKILFITVTKVKLLVQLEVIFTNHFFEFSKDNDCKHFFFLFCGPLGNHAMTHWLGGIDLAQGWPNVAHCMVGGGAFDVSGNLRKCAYRCPEKFVTDY